MTLRILFFGDIIGAPGRLALGSALVELKPKYNPNVTIANAENTTHGFGITHKHFEELCKLDVDVFTSGNHVWDKKEAVAILDENPHKIIRPGNYPSYDDDPCPGVGITYFTFKQGSPPLCIVNTQGRVFMDPIDCPFRFLDEHLEEIKSRTNLIFVDFHAEATSEKMAYAHYFNGKVSAIVGTHEHVQTADEQIFPGGTAYITDVGACGSQYSVIGVRPSDALFRFRFKRPRRFEVAEEQIETRAVVIDIDIKTGKAKSIQRIQIPA